MADLLATLGGAVLAAASAAPPGLPEQASSNARDVDRTIYMVTLISVIAFSALMAAMVYLVIRYRRRTEGQRTSALKGHLGLEIVWTLVPAAVMLGLFYYGFRSWMRNQVAPTDAVEVRVTAFKWGWEFQYPSHGLSFPDLTVPLGRPVKLIMSSKDVIHNFFVPEFRIKKDVLPERYTVLWFKPTKLGVFDVRCAEFCGTQHSRMLTRVRVLPYDEWKKWHASGGGLDKLSPIAYGKQLFVTKCSSCHSDDRDRKILVGPPLFGLAGGKQVLSNGETITADDNYLRESLLFPQKRLVKGYEGRAMNAFPELTDKQIDALIDYLKSLGASAAPAAK